MSLNKLRSSDLSDLIIKSSSSNTVQTSTKEMEDIKLKIQKHFNTLNSQVPDDVWKLDSVSRRATFKGMKLRATWKDRKSEFVVRLKLCTPYDIGGKKINLDNYSLEIEGVNATIEKNQNLFYKQLQHFVDLKMIDLLSRTKKLYHITEEPWIMQFFPKLGATLRTNLTGGKAKKTHPHLFTTLQKQKVNENYILIPPHSNFSWHPKGFVFVVQNPVCSQISGSLIGNKRMINKVFPPQKIQKQMSFYNSVSLPINVDDPYEWNTKQSYDFLDGNYQQLQDVQLSNSQSSYSNDYIRYRSLSMPFKSINDVTTTVDAKDSVEAKLLNQLGSLRLFKVYDGFSKVEDQIKQLIMELNKHKNITILETLLSPLYKNYDSLIHQKILGPFQIKIIQQVFKSSLKQNSYSSFLRAIMAETQCNHSVIINTFNKNLIQLDASPKYQDKMWLYYEYLISYNDFEQYQLQNVFMMMLQLYLAKLKTLHSDKKQITNSRIQDSLFVEVKKHPFIHQIQYVKFVQDSVYYEQINKFIPLYQIRTRHYNFLGYNRMMRVLSANQRLRSCVEFINSIVSNDSIMKDINFLTQVISEYQPERKYLKECKQKRKKRRAWKIQCPKCRNVVTTNQILQQDFVCCACKIS